MASRSSLKRSLRSIERAFADIETTLRRLDKRVRQLDRRSIVMSGPSRVRRPAKLTPTRRAQLKLQGAYMGFMRQLKPAQKARVKAMKARRGFEAAIRAGKRFAGSR
jgi:hypothetical protein